MTSNGPKSPLPWNVPDGSQRVYCSDPRSSSVATFSHPNDAAYAAFAVSSHEDLVRQLAEARVVLKHLLDRPGECLADNPRWAAKIESLLTES